jgi:exopolysaccharide biosynthesis WecB/TagA/CpsF family protein
VRTYLTVYFGTVIVAMFLVPIVSRVARFYHFVDEPGPRRVHQYAIPRIGGIAIFLSVFILVLPVFFLNNTVGQYFRGSQIEFITLLIAAAFVFIIGLIDDLHPVPGKIKLLCIIGASLAICASGATISNISLGKSFHLQTGLAAWPLTIFWIVVITVCINLIDGLDGLAAGIAAIVCGSLVLLAFWSNQSGITVLMLALLGGVTGFIFFNFYPAKIFMGDCGSMFLGFMIGASSIICQNKTSTLIGLAIPFLVLGAPILDTGLVVVSRRILERRSVFSADRNHLHHRLLAYGFKHRTVVIFIYATTVIFASIAMLMLTSRGEWTVELLVGGLLLMFSMFAVLHKGRIWKILKALKYNWKIAHDARKESRIFENAYTKMQGAGSLGEWWNTVCEMCEEMRFHRIELWNKNDGQSINTCTWKPPEDKSTHKNAELVFPLNGNGSAKWEIRANICAESNLERSGRLAMLLGRLMDQFPPPEDDNQDIDLKGRLTIKEKALSNETQTTIQALQRPAYIPTPIEIMKIPVTPFSSYEQALGCAEKIVESSSKSFWVAINPIKIYKAWNNSELLELLRQADVGLCDGMGVAVTSKMLYGKNLFRCTGCDLFFRLISLASRKGWSVYMLGSSAQINEAARAKLLKKYPGLKIAGWQDGYFKDSRKVVERINSSKANILFVAMGSPKQELWIWEHWQAIDTNFCMGVGGSFDIAAGNLKRAPKFFQVTGTEFLYRLICEPLKRGPIQKVLLPYALQVIGKKAVDLTMSTDEEKNE